MHDRNLSLQLYANTIQIMQLVMLTTGGPAAKVVAVTITALIAGTKQ